ncbi:hypothetical protein [Aeromonas phage JELG-KS1]|uniref:Uncharacterized protein n=1 Tax=Aeromonas phage JELG-KS1 TaxID=2951233 RepID=A0A9E7NP81_9CAUD|nr:hypothetical protein [Aeromonas phage JELG-KS1]
MALPTSDLTHTEGKPPVHNHIRRTIVMSIVSKTAKFAIRAVLSGLAREAAAAELKAKKVITKRDAKSAKLDKAIIELGRIEEAKVSKIREQAELEIRQIYGAKNRRLRDKRDLRLNAGIEVAALSRKGQAALELKRKLEAVVA